ncbi:HAL/PAL/TAL family ammonia-lyase [Lichenicoccus roseus]|uniref:Aromatic amino acid lyase n=1 Tax=Lichenicoccus roseus TaxID=2683649 RepID=A0A5R9J9I1_9PROT|nr:aromatic amino acid ammonia-lyase [Lichenicoccus roseus]TLU74235.1 aromatic amino acid lyase [Lichenicoccus roseus]
MRQVANPNESQAADAEPIVLGLDRLTVQQVASYADRRGHVPVEMPPEVRLRINQSNQLKHHLIATKQPIYGVTTGFGDSAARQISPARAAAMQANLILYHLNGSGAEADARTVRATMLIRANCLARGYSGIRLEVIRLLVDCMQADILPVIPERGSVGASGDLVPLCYMAGMLTGIGEVDWNGGRVGTRQALSACGLEPVVLEAKEALALINGTSFMSAYAALAVAAAHRLALIGDLCTALCVEAMAGNVGAFDAIIHLQKPHPGQVESARRVRRLLDGSTSVVTATQLAEAGPVLGERGFVELPRQVQDRYSIRCAPHVLGVLHDTLAWVDRWIETEMNSTNDNPLFDPASGTVLSGGNFYGGHVGQAMDALKIALASVGDLLDRQVALAVDEKFNNGLTANLIPRLDDEDQEAGLHHGYKGMQIACSALAAEALKTSLPATVFSRSTESHNQDKVSMGTIAARDARSVVELVRNICAIHLLVSCQAIDLRGAERLGAATRSAYGLIRKLAPFLDHDRRLDHDVTAVLKLMDSGELDRIAA